MGTEDYPQKIRSWSLSEFTSRKMSFPSFSKIWSQFSSLARCYFDNLVQPLFITPNSESFQYRPQGASQRPPARSTPSSNGQQGGRREPGYSYSRFIPPSRGG